MESSQIEGLARPNANYPHYKRVGDFIFVSGTSARQHDDSVRGATPGENGEHRLDIAEQTRGVIENIAAILERAGAGLEDLCEITTFLAHMADFAAYNQVYDTYFGPDGPTRTTVAVRALPNPRLLIEMKAVAYKPVT